MSKRTVFLLTAALGLVGAASPAYAQSTAAFTGKVTSAEEGTMEGVVVSAKKGIVTVSVVSNDKGEFSFPASKLGAGDYALTIRAVGYNLDGPKAVKLAADKPAAIDVKLVKTSNLTPQLTNLEWMLSVPGTDDQRRALTGCTNCHSVERIVNSSYNAEEFTASSSGWPSIPTTASQASRKSAPTPATSIASSRTPKRSPPTSPASTSQRRRAHTGSSRPCRASSGDGTKVIITEYDLPESDHPAARRDGRCRRHRLAQRFQRPDARPLRHQDAQHKAFAVPLQRQGWPTGALDLETDPHGNLWLGLMFQAGAAKFDTKTAEVLDDPSCRRRCSSRIRSRPWSARRTGPSTTSSGCRTRPAAASTAAT